jgi:hypothetical protein
MKRFLLFLVLLFSPCLLQAQVPVQVAPVPYQQFFNEAGMTLVGGQLFTYAAGTSTPQATYTDSTGTVQNFNPIILDSAGRASIWLPALAYKFVLEDSLGNVQWVQDNVTVAIFPNANISFTGNDSFSGTTTFTGHLVTTSGGTLNGSFAGNPNFTGNPTFSGAPLFVGGITTASITSTNGTPALSGFLRMQAYDSLCWRNFANTADQCLSLNDANPGLFIPYDQIDGSITNGSTPFSITGANGSAAVGQSVTVAGGSGDSSLNGGSVTLQGGYGGAGATTGGNIVLSPGTSVGGFSGDIIINSGVAQDSSGFKHQSVNMCTTGATEGDICSSVLTWTTPFTDSNYTVSCSPLDGSNTPAFYLSNKQPATITANVITFANVASAYLTADCIAVHN